MKNCNSILFDNNYHSKVRIEQIDMFKGIAIFCVIWSHTDNPRFPFFELEIFGVITFFFLSGFFFKVEPDFPQLISKLFYRIIVPFLTFYILSLPFQYIVHLWDYRTLTGFDWSRVWDIFKISAPSDYLSLNVPLWFLITLTVIQLLANLLFRLPKQILFLTVLISFAFKDFIAEWPTFFMFNNALYWYGFFTLGYLFGKPLIKILSSDKVKIIANLSFLFYVSTIISIEVLHWIDYENIVAKLAILSFSIFLLSLLFYVDRIPLRKYLSMIGSNTLIILCTHIFILVPLRRIVHKFTDSHLILFGFITTIITLIICHYLSLFIKNRFPLIAGQYFTPPNQAKY